MTDVLALPQETPEKIAKHYSACLDSVALINGPMPTNMSTSSWADIVARNKEHLTLMLSKPFWTTEDLTSIKAAAMEARLTALESK